MDYRHYYGSANVKNVVYNLVIVILGVFAKLRKTTISFVMFVRPHGTTRLPLDGFS